MIKIIKTGEVKEDGKIKLNGKLVKVGIITNKVMSHVSIKMTTFLDEIIISDNLIDSKTVFYPRVSVDGAPELKNLDYHYLDGFVDIEISGLSEDDTIENILFYLE